ncbi:MAG TPA: hypothetical protein VEG44_00180 [Candidatus Acidoferrales bacterium]|nr:hypothetical protein [Candidatus Acidoferrales bacterium]
MLAFIPIVGPTSAVMLIAGWQIVKLLFVVTGNGASLAGWAPLIGLAVWGVAF